MQPLTEGVFYILLSLHEERHGYGIMQQVEEITKGRLRIGAGTMYGALKSLQEKGWIDALDGEGRQKKYIVTDSGRNVFQNEVIRLQELVKNGLNKGR